MRYPGGERTALPNHRCARVSLRPHQPTVSCSLTMLSGGRKPRRIRSAPRCPKSQQPLTNPPQPHRPLCYRPLSSLNPPWPCLLQHKAQQRRLPPLLLQQMGAYRPTQKAAWSLRASSSGVGSLTKGSPANRCPRNIRTAQPRSRAGSLSVGWRKWQAGEPDHHRRHLVGWPPQLFAPWR